MKILKELNLNENLIKNVASPVDDTDAVTKEYVDMIRISSGLLVSNVVKQYFTLDGATTDLVLAEAIGVDTHYIKVYVNNARLYEGASKDFTIDYGTKTVTLNDTFPNDYEVFVEVLTSIGSVNDVFTRTYFTLDGIEKTYSVPVDIELNSHDIQVHVNNIRLYEGDEYSINYTTNELILVDAYLSDYELMVETIAKNGAS